MAGHKGSKYYNIFLKHQVELVTDDNTVVSEEGFKLLIEIESRNSIVSAAKEMGISYRKAWGLLRIIEQNLGFSLVGKQRGGRDGGRTTFTPEGKELLEAYKDLISGLERSGKEPIRNFFRSINSLTEKR